MAAGCWPQRRKVLPPILAKLFGQSLLGFFLADLALLGRVFANYCQSCFNFYVSISAGGVKAEAMTVAVVVVVAMLMVKVVLPLSWPCDFYPFGA